jgi:hypothetical protein
MSEIKWFIIAFIALWVLWAAAGGYRDTNNSDKPLLHQPAPIENGQPYRWEDRRP